MPETLQIYEKGFNPQKECVKGFAQDRTRLGRAIHQDWIQFRLSLLSLASPKIGCGSAEKDTKLCLVSFSALAFHYLCTFQWSFGKMGTDGWFRLLMLLASCVPDGIMDIGLIWKQR